MKKFLRNQPAIVAVVTLTHMPRAFLPTRPGRREAHGKPSNHRRLKSHPPFPHNRTGPRRVRSSDISKFVQGQHQMLPALERVVTGMKTGDERRIELSPKQGFGPMTQTKLNPFRGPNCRVGQKKEMSSRIAPGSRRRSPSCQTGPR